MPDPGSPHPAPSGSVPRREAQAPGGGPARQERENINTRLLQ